MVVLKKIKSGSLVEVLVASVILSIVLSITILIVLNVSKNRYHKELNKEVNALNEFYYKRKNNRNQYVDLQAYEVIEKPSEISIRFIDTKNKEVTRYVFKK